VIFCDTDSRVIFRPFQRVQVLSPLFGEISPLGNRRLARPPPVLAGTRTSSPSKRPSPSKGHIPPTSSRAFSSKPSPRFPLRPEPPFFFLSAERNELGKEARRAPLPPLVDIVCEPTILMALYKLDKSDVDLSQEFLFRFPPLLFSLPSNGQATKYPSPRHSLSSSPSPPLLFNSRTHPAFVSHLRRLLIAEVPALSSNHLRRLPTLNWTAPPPPQGKPPPEIPRILLVIADSLPPSSNPSPQSCESLGRVS